MDDAFPMSDLQSFSDLNAYLKGIPQWQWSISQPLSQGLALDVLHRDKAVAFSLSGFIDLADEGMVQSSSRLCLSQESPVGYLIIGKRSRKELQGYLPSQGPVLREVDFSHSTLTEFLKHFVVGDCLADHRLPPGELMESMLDRRLNGGNPFLAFVRPAGACW
jgi:hypothetical protein